MSNKISSVRIKEDASTYSDPIEFSTFADNVFLNRQTNSPTILDTFNDYLFRNGLAADTDLDDIVTPGQYACATAANAGTILHKPIGLGNHEFVMQVYQIDAVGNKIQQVLTSMYDGAVWTRSRAAASGEGYTWTIWTGSYGAGSVIPSNSSLDDYMEPGVYVSQNASVSATITNAPTTSYSFVMLVFSLGKDTTGRVQLVLQAGAGRSKMWTRTKSGSTWTQWVNYNFFGLAQTQITSGTDLNTLFATGTYRCTSDATAATLINCPLEVAFIMDIRHSYNSSYVFQIIKSKTGAVTYIRQCKSDGTDFGNWNKYYANNSMKTIASGTDLNTLTETGLTYVSPDSTTTNSLLNCPTTGAGGILQCYEHTNQRYIQIWTNGATLVGIWTRAYSSTGWSRWKKQDMLSWVGETIPANANLNDYIETGIYRCTAGGTAATLSNCPTSTAAFLLEVRKTISANYIIQTVYTYTGDQTFRRRITLSSETFSSAGSWIRGENPLLLNAIDSNDNVIIGTPDNIVNYCKVNSITPTNQIYTYGFVGGTGAIFDTAGMTVINRFTSSNYGWMLCLSDKVDQAPIHIAYSSGTTTVNRLESVNNKGYIKQLTASDDLFTLAPGHYRIYNALPTSIPIDMDPLQKFGYVTVYYESTYTYYDLVAGSGDYLNQGRWIGWKKGGASASTINWMRLDNNGLGKDLPTNANLNNYTSAGLYRCSTKAIAQSLINCPTNQTFKMEIKGSYQTSSRLQIIYTSDGQKQYIRSGELANNVWTWDNWYVYEGKFSNNFKKILFIGDSYCEGYSHDGNNDGWAWHCGQYLGLTGTKHNSSNYNNTGTTDASSNDDFERIYRGGAKFYSSTANTGYTFKELLTEAHDNRFPNYIFSDIICCGGYNDRENTQANIESAIADFITQAKTYYPYAKIYIGHISYNKQGDPTGDANTTGYISNWTTYRNNLKTITLPAYRNCIKYGANYLYNVEYALNETGLTFSDGYHPNDYGNQCIGKAVAEAFLSGKAEITDKPNSFYKGEKRRKILFLGDGYLEGFSNTAADVNDGWGVYCGNALGLKTTIELSSKLTENTNDASPTDDYERLYVGGARFAYTSTSQSISFKYLLQTAPTKFPNYQFTDIVACGGYGDRTYTEAAILGGIEEFCNLAKQLYPDVNIYIGHISWNKMGNGANSPSQSDYTNWHNYLITRTIPAYQKCSQYGAKYLNNVEYWLGDSGLSDNDGYSANETGNKLLGMAIANALMTGSAPLPYKDLFRIGVTMSTWTGGSY